MLAVAVHDALAGSILRLLRTSYARARVAEGKAGWHEDTTGMHTVVPSYVLGINNQFVCCLS